MKTLNDIIDSIFPVLSDEPFKLSVDYVDSEWDFRIADFDITSEDNKKWSVFKEIYGECHVVMVDINFREPDTLEYYETTLEICLWSNDTTKIKSDKRGGRR